MALFPGQAFPGTNSHICDTLFVEFSPVSLDKTHKEAHLSKYTEAISTAVVNDRLAASRRWLFVHGALLFVTSLTRSVSFLR